MSNAGAIKNHGKAGDVHAATISPWSALRLMGISRRHLFLPSGLRAIEGVLGVVILASWLPLLHVVITSELRLGRKFQLIEDLVPESGKIGTLVFLGLFILAATVARIICSCAADLRTASITGIAEGNLADKILRCHLRYGQSYFDSIHPARIIRNLKRVPARSAKLVRWLIRLKSTVLLLALYLGLMAWLSPALTAASLCLFFVYHVLLKRLLDRSEDRSLANEKEDDEGESDTRDLAENLMLLRLHVPENETAYTFRSRTDRRAKMRDKRESLSSLLEDIREGGNTILMLAFLMGAGFMLGGVTHGDVARYLVFFMVFRRAVRPFATLQKAPEQWQSIRASVCDAYDLLRDEGKAIVADGSKPAPADVNEVSIRHLSFAYPQGNIVLRNISLTMSRGRLNVLCGPNGCGKSTLLKLLLRLYDVPENTIHLDGQDIRDFKIEPLRQAIGYAEADPMLLNASIRDNLGLGLSSVSDDEIWHALELVELADFLRSLEGGLDHEIGNRGLRLSAGQRQRIALARTLLRKPRIVLLDEASSSLDAASEASLMRLLAAMSTDLMIITATHRLTSLPMDAQVFVLDAGRVMEQGNALTLVSAGGMFNDAALKPLDRYLPPANNS